MHVKMQKEQQQLLSSQLFCLDILQGFPTPKTFQIQLQVESKLCGAKI